MRCEGIGECFDDAKHGPLLERLWAAAHPTLSFEGRTSTEWLVLGFQQEDPTLDLRGVGVFGLRQLVRFCGGSGHRGAEAVREVSAGKSSFPLAAMSLTVTQMLCSHLGLLAQPAGGVGALVTCTDSVFHEAWRLQIALGEDLSLVDLIHEQLLCRLHDEWQNLVAGSALAPSTLMHYCPALLRELGEHLTSTLEASVAAPTDLASLLLALRQAPLPQQGLSCWEAAGALLDRLPLPVCGGRRSGGGPVLALVSAMVLLGAAQPVGQC